MCSVSTGLCRVRECWGLQSGSEAADGKEVRWEVCRGYVLPAECLQEGIPVPNLALISNLGRCPVSPLPLPGLLYSTQMQEHLFPLGGDTLYICFTCSWAAVAQALMALHTQAPEQDRPLPSQEGPCCVQPQHSLLHVIVSQE